MNPIVVRRRLSMASAAIVVVACALPATASADDAVPPVVDGPSLRLPLRLSGGGLVAQLKDGAGERSAEPARAKSRADALLADDNLDDLPAPATKFFGFDQVEAAYTIPRPAHWSKLVNRLELGAQGSFSDSIKWKVSGRLDYDAIYDLSNFYPHQVRDDQRLDATFRETYLDVGSGDLDLRIGRQQIIWGEVVGLFFADVVSAKDLRQSIATDFDLLRIPQWAARAEYFKNDIHLEAIWVPVPSIDKIGKPGSDFFPYPPPAPPGYAEVINNERKPQVNASNENFGARASILRGGWDVAGFAYRSVDATATFLRQVVPGPTPTIVYTPVHEKVTQYGGTASKDFGDFLLKTEAVYTVGRQFNVTRLSDSDGVVPQNFLDYIVSVDVPLPDDAHFNAQFFQRRFKDHDPDIIPKAVESGVTLFLSGKLTSKLEPQLLFVHSLNRNDWLARPKLVWNFQKDWRAVAGADIFGGPPTGLFGQYNAKDRVYVEVRRSF